MPGLIGFANKQNGGHAETFLQALARALEPTERFRIELYHDQDVGLGRVSLGIANPEPQPIWNDAGTVCLFMEGEIYGADGLKQLLIDRGHQFKAGGQAELLLRLYEQFGDDFALKLNGAFVIAIWDQQSRKLLVTNDRLGLYPLYYAQVNGSLLFASGVRALLAHPALPRTVDPVAINQFLVHDHLLDDRTLLNHVKLLPQASLLTVAEGELTIRPYWTLKYPVLYQAGSEGEYIEQLLHYLRQAVARQSHGDQPAGMLLSGGLDSRMLLALLREGPAGDPFYTFTWGIPGCDDARAAREVAARLGTEHHFFELKPDWLLDLAAEGVRLTDGLGNIINLHALATLREETQYAQVLYKGFMGDAMLGFALKRQMWADYSDETRYQVHRQVHAEQGVINYTHPEQQQLFTDAFQRQVGCSVFETYRAGLDRAEVPQLANQRLYFDLTQRVPRMTINGVEVVRSRAVVRLPFCDNDLLDFVLTVPPGFLFGRYLIEAAFSRTYPRLAQIPVPGEGLPLVACFRDIRLRAGKLIRWHLRQKGLGRLAGPELRPYKDYANWFRTGLRGWVEETLLNRHSLERGYFKPDYVRQLVADHMAGANHTVRLGALLTLELWHRQFLD